MSFYIKCNKCSYDEDIKENFNKKDELSIEIVGEEIVRIRCNFCNNEIHSSYED